MRFGAQTDEISPSRPGPVASAPGPAASSGRRLGRAMATWVGVVCRLVNAVGNSVASHPRPCESRGMPNSAVLPRSVEEAVALEDQGRAFKYVFFWGHEPEVDGRVGRECLSQWWPSAFIEDGRSFSSAEHYMMAHKAWLFGDDECAERILAASHPGAAQRLGRTVQGFDQEHWSEERFGIVVRGNLAKFGQHSDLRAYLLGTRERVLVEASPVDQIWGVGLAADDSRVGEPSKWRGLNLLGFALMAARSELDDVN